MGTNMSRNATRVTALVGAVALMTALAAPALAGPGGSGKGQQSASSHRGPGVAETGAHGSGGQGIGIGRLIGLDLTPQQITAVHRALVEARSTMQMSGRAEAIAVLLKAQTINEAQAKALTGAVGRSAMRALIAVGIITRAQARALQAAMVPIGAPDRTAANLAALNALVVAAVIDADDVMNIMARLSSTEASSQGISQGQGRPQGPESEGSGHGHGQGSTHSNSGGHDQGTLGVIGADDDSEDGTDD
jgi:hypothetical protein